MVGGFLPDLLTDLLANVDQIRLPGLLIALFLAGLIEVVFPPFPGDATFLAGGFVAGRRDFLLAWPVCAAWLGTFLAAALLFLVGRIWGRPLLKKRFFARLLPLEQQKRIERWFTRYGLWVVLGSRFIPVVRSGIALAAGIVGLRPLSGLLGLAAGAFAFDTLLVVGGSLAGEHWPVLASLIGAYGLVLGALLTGIFVVRAALARRRT